MMWVRNAAAASQLSEAEISPNESGTVAAEKQNIQENTTETEASDSLAGMADVETLSGSQVRQTTGEQIAELAKLYIGNPYKAGGTDLEYGTDSIGFVKAIYALVGIELPADIQALASVGTEVSPEDLLAGDIIIYSSADGENKAFHAAVYDGSGRVIHARVCLKIAFCQLCVTVCGRFVPNEGCVVGYVDRMRDKSPAKWGVQMAGMNFKTHSSNMKTGIKLSQFDYREISKAIRIIN